MTGEHVILLDEHDKPSGILEKYAAHTLSTPLHLAFSCWLFDESGQLLVTRRSLSKIAWPGVWTNSVCGHPQQGETFEQAITRRSRFEPPATQSARRARYSGALWPAQHSRRPELREHL